MGQFFKFLITSNLYISFCASSLYVLYAFILEINFFLSTPFFIFASTYFAYHLVRYIPFKKDHPIEKSYRIWYLKYKLFFRISIGLSLLTIILTIKDLETRQLLVLGFSFLILLFYEKILTKRFELRKISYAKPFIIGFVWSLVCVGISIKKLNQASILVFIDCFLFISILCLAFDIKDKKFDKENGIKTIAHIFKRDGELIVLASLLFSFYFAYHLTFISHLHIEFHYFFSLILFVFALTQMRFKAGFKPYQFALIIDGLILVKSFAYFDYLPWLKSILELK